MKDRVLLLILLVALGARVQLAMTRDYIHDEDNTAIPLSKTISFAPGNLHLPLRGENHPALPAYVVKASSTLFGTTHLGYRLMHVLLGLVTIALVYAMTRQWYGPGPARWAAVFLAFNEYHLNVSSRATAHVPHLLLVTVAVYAFSRFLATERAIYLYAAGASAGLAFYCKESTGLLLPVFALTLVISKHRRWLLGPHVYLACAVMRSVISPDIIWNLRTNPDTAKVSYNNEAHGQATYAAHLRRIGGLGLSPYPSMFYFRGPVRSLYARVTGSELKDETTDILVGELGHRRRTCRRCAGQHRPLGQSRSGASVSAGDVLGDIRVLLVDQERRSPGPSRSGQLDLGGDHHHSRCHADRSPAHGSHRKVAHPGVDIRGSCAGNGVRPARRR